MPEVAEKMKLIDDNTQGIFICFGRKLGDVDSRMLWWEYKELLENTQMNYAEKKVRLHDLRSEMNAFIYQLRMPHWLRQMSISVICVLSKMERNTLMKMEF